MEAIEFNTISKDGLVVIPEQYRAEWDKRKIRVILMGDEQEKTLPKKSLMASLKSIEKISGPEDFTENLDAYLNGEKHA